MLLKKGLLMILSVAILLSVFQLNVFADFISIDEISSSQITLSDNGGNPVNPIKPNTDVYASISVKKEGFSVNYARLILAYYENNILKGINSDSAYLADEYITLTASVRTGSDVSNARIQAFLWDGYKASRILNKKADFYAGSCEVTGIYINKSLINGFNKDTYEYNYVLPLDEYNYPEIFVETNDLSTKVEITYNGFPGYATINVYSFDNSKSKSYRINFTKEPYQISNIVMKLAGDASKIIPESSILFDVAPPVFKTGPDAITNPEQNGYYDTPNLESWTSTFGDSNNYRNNYFYSLPEILDDAYYIRLNRLDRGDRLDTVNNPNANPNATDVLTFDINASADVYYVFMDTTLNDSNIASYAPWLNTYNWQKTDQSLQFVESSGAIASTKPGTKGIMKKTFVVGPGETKRVSIGGSKQSYFVPVVFVKFIGRDNNALIKSIKADGIDIAEFDPERTEYKYLLDSGSATPDEITALPVVDGANVSVSKSVNGSETTFTVSITSIDNTVTNTYKFIYNVWTPEITNVIFKKYSTDTTTENIQVSRENIIESGFTPPVYKTGEGAITDPTEIGYYDTTNMLSWFSVFADTNYSKYIYFYDLPEYLKEATYIRLTRAWREPRTNANNPNAMTTQSEVLTFDINNTANVYYVYPETGTSSMGTRASWLIDEGWTICNERVDFVESNNVSSQNPQIKKYILMKKTFTVEKGETAKVRIGGYYQSYYVPMVFIEWVED